MPCIPVVKGIPIAEANGTGTAFVHVGNIPMVVWHNGRRYYFAWTGACGWVACTKGGYKRLSPVPAAVWELVDKLPRGD